MDEGEHQAIEMLLPWFVIGSLEHHEMEEVERHLERCAYCTEALAAERQLKAMIVAIGVPPMPAAIPLPGAVRMPLDPRPVWSRGRHGVAGLVQKPARVATLAAAQVAVLLIAFQVGQMVVPAPIEYRLLSSGEASGSANLIVMFDETVLVTDLSTIVNGIDGSIVDGPTDSNAYLVRVEASRIDDALKLLGRDPRVLLAQPLDAE